MSNEDLLTEAEIAELLEAHPQWRRDGDVLRRSYLFADFRAAFAFMTHVALIAERLFHHPSGPTSTTRSSWPSPATMSEACRLGTATSSSASTLRAASGSQSDSPPRSW